MAKGKLALGAVFGAVAGFVTGVLIAPKSGKDTRDELKQKATKAKDTVVDEAEKVKDTAQKTARDVKAKAEEVIDEVTDKATDLKGRAEKAIKGAKEGYNESPDTKKKPQSKTNTKK